MRALLLLGGLALALAGCTGPAGGADPAADDPSRGRKLYVARCAKCHKLYDPNRYSDPDWQQWMLKMSRKAKLKPEQAELVARYVETLRRGKTAADRSD